MAKNANGSWVDGFLAYRDEFEFAERRPKVMGIFEALRKQHEPLAEKAFGEGLTALRQGKPTKGSPGTRRSWTRTMPRRATAPSRSS